MLTGDARDLSQLESKSVDTVFTSPPYWQKRNYGHSAQIGQEDTSEAYITTLMQVLNEWRRVLRPHGSAFINLGDTYRNKQAICIPERFIVAAAEAGWHVQQKIIWAKKYGMPSPHRHRLFDRFELIYHVSKNANCYSDPHGYKIKFGSAVNAGNVWMVKHTRTKSKHLAAFPQELAERAITLATPKQVCRTCKQPRTRLTEASAKLNPNRPQAIRAMEIYQASNLTEAHLRAIRATGIQDAGKALEVGGDKNAAETARLAKEAKEVLGGYFREFTFPLRKHAGWTNCDCRNYEPGVVLDPFAGCGTTLQAANALRRDAIGVDLIEY